MLQRTIFMHYHMEENSNFRDPETMRRFLDEVAAQGYALTTLKQTPALAPAQMPISTGVSAALEYDLMRFSDGKSAFLWILALPVAQSALLNNCKCGITFDAASKTCSCVLFLDTIGFTANVDVCTRVFESWLRLFLAVYNTWHPVYAHSLAPELNWPEPQATELEADRLSYLYELNFLGPKLVERLGKEHITNAPVWKALALADGGMLVIPEFIFARRDPDAWEKAAQHFGATQIFRGRYILEPL